MRQLVIDCQMHRHSDCHTLRQTNLYWQTTGQTNQTTVGLIRTLADKFILDTKCEFKEKKKEETKLELIAVYFEKKKCSG